MQLALDKANNDLIKKSGGGVERVSEGRYTVQTVRNKLQTRLGEWIKDPTIGWIGLDDFERGYDLFALELRAKKVILSTQGVLSITSMTLEVSQRTLLLTFSAKTIYGEIDLTIPWSN